MPRSGGLILQRWNKAIQQIVEKLPRLTMETAEASMEWVLDELVSEMPDRPPKSTAKAQWPGFATDRQRRWFFWALKSGELAKQAASTKSIATGWETEAKATSEGVIGILANTRPYAPWVIGPSYPGVVYPGLSGGRAMYQAKIHAGRWFQLGKYMQDKSDEVWDRVFEDMLDVLKDLVSGPMWN